MFLNPFRRLESSVPVRQPNFEILRHYGLNALPRAPEIDMEPEDEACYRRIRVDGEFGRAVDLQQLAAFKAKYSGTWVERSIDAFLQQHSHV